MNGVAKSWTRLSTHIFKFYSFSKFSLYNTVLLTIITMLCIRSSDLIHLIAESLRKFSYIIVISLQLPFVGRENLLLISE